MERFAGHKVQPDSLPFSGGIRIDAIVKRSHTNTFHPSSLSDRVNKHPDDERYRKRKPIQDDTYAPALGDDSVNFTIPANVCVFTNNIDAPDGFRQPPTRQAMRQCFHIFDGSKVGKDVTFLGHAPISRAPGAIIPITIRGPVKFLYVAAPAPRGCKIKVGDLVAWEPPKKGQVHSGYHVARFYPLAKEHTGSISNFIKIGVNIASDILEKGRAKGIDAIECLQSEIRGSCTRDYLHLQQDLLLLRERNETSLCEKLSQDLYCLWAKYCEVDRKYIQWFCKMSAWLLALAMAHSNMNDNGTERLIEIMKLIAIFTGSILHLFASRYDLEARNIIGVALKSANPEQQVEVMLGGRA